MNDSIQKLNDVAPREQDGCYNIDLRDLDELIQKADEIFVTAKGEEMLKKLLTVQDIITDAIAQAKIRLESAGLKMSKDFKSIQADEIKVSYRSYGTKFIIDPTQIDLIPPELIQKKVTVTGDSLTPELELQLKSAGFNISTSYEIIDTKNVEKFIKAHRSLPAGITAPERKKTISIGWKKKSKGAIV
ncbi:MAG: hypothetical protein WBO32_01070 [Cyclobacteriaceae bacterium]